MSRSNSLRCNNDNVLEAVVFDIDGVLADNSNRLAHLDPEEPDWDLFHRRAPLDGLLVAQARLVEMLLDGGFRVILLSSRPEHCRADTEAWLAQQKVEYHRLYLHGEWMVDSHSDYKRAILEDLMLQYNVRLLVDDNRDVCEVAESLGIPALYIHSNYYDRSTWGTALRSTAESRHEP